MKLYNTLLRKKQVFKSQANKKVSIYVCGITPYDTTHLGHAFTYISFDVLIRYLKYRGFEVNYTQNVTDINDRDNDILKRAKEQNTTWQELSNFWTEKFLKDMEFLNWIKPQNFLYASKQIPQMVDLIEKLINKDIAYVVDGSVYFDVSKDETYGELSKLTEKQMFKVAKDYEEDIASKDKRHPLDITLWRRKNDYEQAHIPWFDSPFGKGRPGWHIECSTMAITSLGEQIDIHGGGKDLIFPHHEAEIAQSEMATGRRPFARVWMHTGQVYCQGKKMSKSLGNLVMISDLRKKYSANAIRFMLLSNHYRDDWEYSEELIENAKAKMQKIEKYLGNGNTSGIDLTGRIEACLEDDLNTPLVLDIIYKNLSAVNTIKTKLILRALGFIL